MSWAEAWRRLLYDAVEPARMRRGLHYAEEDRVVHLAIDYAGITAQIEGKRAHPYDVMIYIPVTQDQRHLENMYALLADDATRETVLNSLVPRLPASDEITTMCSCPDWEEPCKHVVAVWEVIARQIAVTPELLLDILTGKNEREIVSAERKPVHEVDSNVFWTGTKEPATDIEIKDRAPIPGWVLYPPAPWPEYLRPYPDVISELYERMEKGARRILARLEKG